MVALTERLRLALKGTDLTQVALAATLHISEQVVSRTFRGDVVPSLDLLAAIHRELVVDRGQASTEPFGDWLLDWVEAKARAEKPTGGTGELVDAWLEQARQRFSPGPRRLGREPRWSLEHFPWEGPLTIVTGDRREHTPQTWGDIFAYSGSVLDIRWLLDLPLAGHDVELISDKVFTVMSDAYLKEHFSRRHLLIVGSKAVNLAARRIEDSVFRFVQKRSLRAFESEFKAIQGQTRSRPYLEAFWQAMQDSKPGVSEVAQVNQDGLSEKSPVRHRPTPQEVHDITQKVRDLLGSNTERGWMNLYRGQGIIDPADLTERGHFTRPDNDFALISLARHPFAALDDDRVEFVAVLVMGIHGPGTAKALQWLASAEHFVDHRYGGVLELRHLDPEAHDWATRVGEAKMVWETKPYDEEVLIRNLSVVAGQRVPDAFESMDLAEVEQLREFVEGLNRGRKV